MKKYYFLALSLLFSASVFSQPILDQTYFPTIGKFFSGRSFYQVVPLPAIQEGPNQTWDFSGLDSAYITDYNFAFRVKNVQNTDSSALFPGATSAYVSYFGTDSIENFQKTTGNDLEYLGFNVKGSPLSERFSIPRVSFRAGLTFEETFIKQSRSTLKVGSTLKYLKYRDTISYVGYGKVITPFATYDTVVLLKQLFSYDYSFNENGPFEPGYVGKNWLWFLPGLGVPYLTYYEEVDLLVPDAIKYGGYVGFIAPVSNKKRLTIPQVTLVPNPANPGSSLQVVGLPKSVTGVSFIDALGKKRSLPISDGNKINTQDLPSGVYSVVIETMSGQAVTRFVQL
jgi:hypothetical protein